MHADSATDEKRFATLAARFALAGHALIRTKEGDGQAPYYCTRWGFIRPVQSLDHADQLLEQMTGKQ